MKKFERFSFKKQMIRYVNIYLDFKSFPDKNLNEKVNDSLF